MTTMHHASRLKAAQQTDVPLGSTAHTDGHFCCPSPVGNCLRPLRHQRFPKYACVTGLTDTPKTVPADHSAGSPESLHPSFPPGRKSRATPLRLTQPTNPPASPPPKTQLGESSQGPSSLDRHPTAKFPHQYFLEKRGHRRNSKIAAFPRAFKLETRRLQVLVRSNMLAFLHI